MAYYSRVTTCRFCKAASCDGAGQVKYGTRHYACFECYLDAGKTLDKLPVWQIGEFPFRLLKERGLMEVARALTAPKAAG